MECNSNLLGSGVSFLLLIPHNCLSDPLLGLPVSCPHLPHQIPQAPCPPLQPPQQTSPESSCLQAAPASTVHCCSSLDCAVFRLPLLPLHTNLPPQLQQFSGFSLSLPPCTRTVSPDPAVSRFPQVSPVHRLASLGSAVFRTPLLSHYAVPSPQIQLFSGFPHLPCTRIPLPGSAVSRLPYFPCTRINL